MALFPKETSLLEYVFTFLFHFSLSHKICFVADKDNGSVWVHTVSECIQKLYSRIEWILVGDRVDDNVGIRRQFDVLVFEIL